MQLSRLTEPPPAPLGRETRQAKVELKGGPVEITYTPVPKEERELSASELLNSHLLAWNVLDNQGLPAALNADVIAALSPPVRDAFLAVLKGERPPAPEKPVPERAVHERAPEEKEKHD
jgi:hypothetical protein